MYDKAAQIAIVAAASMANLYEKCKTQEDIDAIEDAWNDTFANTLMEMLNEHSTN